MFEGVVGGMISVVSPKTVWFFDMEFRDWVGVLVLSREGDKPEVGDGVEVGKGVFVSFNMTVWCGG